MKILYVVSRPLEINTSSSIRNRATINGLLELGHEVDLITTQYDKNHSNYEGYEVNAKINVEYLKLSGVQGLARLGRKYIFISPLKKIVYNISSKYEVYDNLKGIANYATKLKLNDDTYDLVISSSDPKSSHLLVHKMFNYKILNKTSWIQIWGDPFFSDITRKRGFLDAKIKAEEEKLLKYPKKVIYVSPLTLNEQQTRYSKYKEKMIYIPIPYLEKVIYPINIEKKSELTILYSGDYASNIRNINPLYEAIKECGHKLVICGSSDLNLSSSENISIYPRVNFKKIKELEAQCDVLVHLSNSNGTQVPGKIYQYSGTNKPILFILDGEKDALKEMFISYQRFIFCDNSKDEIAKSLTALEEGLVFKSLYPIDDFSPINIAQRILGETGIM